MSQNLRTFLRQAIAADAGNVKVVEHRVDRKFAIQAHAAKLAERAEYPALLFMDVEGSRFPCVANVLATYERIALALGCNVKDIPKAYGEMLSKPVPSVEVERSAAPVKDVVVNDVDLETLPIGFHNELDGGPYVTAGVSVLRDPETGVQNAGIYRHHVFSSTTMGCLMGSTHDGGIIHEKYSKRGEGTPIAVAIGHHPALLLAAVARLPGIGGEFEAAGGFLRESVTLVKAETSDLMVPAEAEFVLEGYLEPNRQAEEGPFGEWPGHYLGDQTAPVMTITTITHRRDAIWQDVMSSAREHLLLGGLPRAGSIYRSVKEVVPGVVSVNVPAESRMHCYISIKRRKNVDVKRAAFAALTTEPDNLRAVIVVDDDINIFDDRDVLWAVGTRFDATRDLTIIRDWSGPGSLLPSNWEYHEDGSRDARTSSAMIIDATKPLPPTPYPPRTKVPDAALNRVDLTKLEDLSPDHPLLREKIPALI
jgi:2,5-furandicarboxylate decarboxylase 1